MTLIPGSRKEMFTVLSCVSGVGHVYPPFILFKGKHLYEQWCQGGPPGTGYGVTDFRWMWKCGIFPFNPDAIPKEKMLPAQVVAEPPDTSFDVPSTSASSLPDIHFNCQAGDPELTPRKAIREAVLSQLKINQSTPINTSNNTRGPWVKRNHSSEVLTEDSVLEQTRVEEQTKKKKMQIAEQKREAAALKRMTKSSISKAKSLKSKLTNKKVQKKTKLRKRNAKQIWKNLQNDLEVEQFSDSEGDDDCNDPDYMAEIQTDEPEQRFHSNLRKF